MSVRPWEVLDSNTLLDERYLRVARQRVKVGSGAIIDDYHLVTSPSWAGIVCVTEARELVLVRQYRHGHGASSLELPAGIVDPGEDVLEGAVRELREETGYVGRQTQLFWKIRPEPARHEQWAHFAVARGARKLEAQDLDETEDIQIVTRSLDDFDSVLEEMVHGVHVAALLLAERRGLLK